MSKKPNAAERRKIIVNAAHLLNRLRLHNELSTGEEEDFWNFMKLLSAADYASVIN